MATAPMRFQLATLPQTKLSHPLSVNATLLLTFAPSPDASCPAVSAEVVAGRGRASLLAPLAHAVYMQ